jgi:hypothetical protein
MLFKDILLDVDFDDVWQILSKEYRLSSKLFKRYREVFKELHKMPPQANARQLEITLFNIENENKTGRPHYDVAGLHGGQRYALELIPWDEWLGFDLSEDTVDLFGVHVVVACCLHEMTLCGYHSFEVSIARNAMSQRMQSTEMTKKESEK